MATKEISVFVDESGSFDPDAGSSRYYLICIVLHDQDSPIDQDVEILNTHLDRLGIGEDHCVHAGPLIRREGEYANLTREIRRNVFSKMLAFIRRADITYKCFCIDKKYIDRVKSLHDALLQKMVGFLASNAEVFNEYDAIKVYYDNGQIQVKEILKEAFALFSSKVEYVADVKPSRYRLFQAADVICTLDLMRAKLDDGGELTKSEFVFFGGVRDLKRNVLRFIKVKEM